MGRFFYFKIKLYIATIIAILAITVANLLVGYLYLSGPLKENKVVIIEKNLSIKEIAEKLASSEVVKYPLLFELISYAYLVHDTLKSGEYEFTASISPVQVIRKLASGKSVIHKFVIPEGATIYDILERINSEERLFGQINGNIPEGYLMPSTYFYSYGDQREAMVAKMRNGMSAALDEVMLKLSPDSPLKSRLDVLILASIVEKEAGNDSERPMIAAVFLNRLKKGMKLQADPTSIYAITDGKYNLGRPVTKKDLAFESPYNTYYANGLPPGAISCPGKKSLEAVVSPAKTDALYFVIDGRGGHNFSKSLDEHNNNVRQIRKNRE